MSEARREEMVCQIGTVIQYEAGKVLVTIDQTEHCEGCAAAAHCGAMLSSDKPIEVASSKELAVGQKVEIGLMPGAILKASILLFIFPAVAFAIGIALGYWAADFIEWADKQWTGFVFGLLLTAITYWGIRLATPRLEKKITMNR